MEISSTTPDEYLATLGGADHETMTTIDSHIVDAMPGRRRVLWEGVFWGGTEQSIIGYGHIIQPRPKGEDVEWFSVGLARQSSTFSVYVNAVEGGAYLGKVYADRLGTVKLGSASIGFRKLENLDLDGFRAMIEHAHRITPPDPER
ncbi:MAG: hypothetical protein AAF467_06455 [Actinomycetota bacterium]